MSITTKKIQETAMNDTCYVDTLHVVKIGSSKFGFTSSVDAARAYRAFEKAIRLGGWSALPTVYQAVHGDGEVEIEMSREKVQMCDNEALPIDGTYQHFACDHNIVKASDVCGIKTCYNSADDRDGYNPPIGWHVSSRLAEDGSEQVLVTCPDCAKSLAEVEGVEVDDLTSEQLWEQRDFELAVIERNKK